MRMEIFEWVYSSIDILERKPNDEPLSIGSWDAQIKHAELYS